MSVVIAPIVGLVVSPVAGEVTMVYPTEHAFEMRTTAYPLWTS